MNKIALILLDCDGVLYDVNALTYEELVSACQKGGTEVGLDWRNFATVHDQLKAKGIRGLYNTVLDLCRQQNIAIQRVFSQMVMHVNYAKIPTDPTMEKLIHQLLQKYPVKILTNNSRPHLECVFRQVLGQSIADFGIEVITAEDILRHGYFQFKQMSGALTELVHLLGYKNEQVLLIDDTEENIRLAEQQGLQTVLIQNPQHTKQVLKGLL